MSQGEKYRLNLGCSEGSRWYTRRQRLQVSVTARLQGGPRLVSTSASVWVKRLVSTIQAAVCHGVAGSTEWRGNVDFSGCRMRKTDRHSLPAAASIWPSKLSCNASQSGAAACWSVCSSGVGKLGAFGCPFPAMRLCSEEEWAGGRSTFVAGSTFVAPLPAFRRRRPVKQDAHPTALPLPASLDADLSRGFEQW